MQDDNRPTLTLTSPRPGVNAPLTRILVGMHDYDTGLDMDSFRVVADFPLDGAAPGELLAAKRCFPPSFLHETWHDYLYWDAELEAVGHQVSTLQAGNAVLVTLHVYSPPLMVMGTYSLMDTSRGEEPMFMEFCDAAGI